MLKLRLLSRRFRGVGSEVANGDRGILSLADAPEGPLMRPCSANAAVVSEYRVKLSPNFLFVLLIRHQWEA
jgi:hypothetical protein